jgi:RNA polymerase sigma-70 factor (ECF subfamily)
MKTLCQTFLDSAVQSDDDADRERVLRFQAGDESAFEEIVRAHEERLARLVYRLLGWSPDGDDILQEVFVAVLGNLHRFRGDAKFSTWITTIAVRKCRSHQRRQWLWFKSRARVAEERRKDIAPFDGGADDGHEELRSAVRALPAKLREPLVLRYFEELPIPEIAAALGISVGAVDVRLNRARQRLKETVSRVRTTDD